MCVWCVYGVCVCGVCVVCVWCACVVCVWCVVCVCARMLSAYCKWDVCVCKCLSVLEHMAMCTSLHQRENVKHAMCRCACIFLSCSSLTFLGLFFFFNFVALLHFPEFSSI